MNSLYLVIIEHAHKELYSYYVVVDDDPHEGVMNYAARKARIAYTQTVDVSNITDLRCVYLGEEDTEGELLFVNVEQPVFVRDSHRLEPF